MGDELAAALIALGAIAFVGFLVWMRHRTRQAQRQLALDRQKLLLDKVGSGPALNEFLASEQGVRFLDDFRESDQSRSNVKHSITSAITAGIVLICGGLSLLITVNFLGPLFDSDYWHLFALGLLGMGVGTGLLIASAFTYGLSKKWGLLKD